MSNSPVVYDKAKYHHDTVINSRMKLVQSEVHTAFYLGWIIEKNLCSEFFTKESPKGITKIEKNKKEILRIYEYWDCVFMDEMLTDEGNRFTQSYFDFEKGQYIHDYMRTFNVGDGADFFGVKFTDQNYTKIFQVVDSRYHTWKCQV